MNALNTLIAFTVLGVSVLCRGEASLSTIKTALETKPLAQQMKIDHPEVTFKTQKLDVKKFDFQKAIRSEGGADAGGGDTAIDSKGQRRLLDLIEKEDLDFFNPQVSYGGNFIIATGMASLFGNTCEATNKIVNCAFKIVMQIAYGAERLSNNQIGVYDLYSRNPKLLGIFAMTNNYDVYIKANMKFGSLPKATPLKWAFTESRLEDIQDEGIIRIDNPETKKQLAIQKDGLVVISRKEFNGLDPLSKNALFVHESALYAAKLLNPKIIQGQGTAPVRLFVRRLIKLFGNFENNVEEIYSYEAVKAGFDALEIPKGRGTFNL